MRRADDAVLPHGEGGRLVRDRLYAGRAAAAALSLALAVTLARATPGLSVDWRGCSGGLGVPVDDAEAVLNVLLLVPWGVAAAYALRRFWPVVAVGAGASLLIELARACSATAPVTPTTWSATWPAP